MANQDPPAETERRTHNFHIARDEDTLCEPFRFAVLARPLPTEEHYLVDHIEAKALHESDQFDDLDYGRKVENAGTVSYVPGTAENPEPSDVQVELNDWNGRTVPLD